MTSPLQVLYEDNHLLVINKPAGVLVQGDATGDKPLVEIGKEYIKVKYQKPGDVFLGVVHRLDRPVSGVVVFARTSKALERMNALFRERETLKTYWALVHSIPPRPEGTLVHWLVKDEKKNKTTAYARENPQGQRSELSYNLHPMLVSGFMPVRLSLCIRSKRNPSLFQPKSLKMISGNHFPKQWLYYLDPQILYELAG
jgi:23S rRNA-/tRNA-specific pseudouridylate synthase